MTMGVTVSGSYVCDYQPSRTAGLASCHPAGGKVKVKVDHKVDHKVDPVRVRGKQIR